MINQVEAKPGTGMSLALNLCPRCKNFLVPCPDCLSPAPAPESQGESVAAPAEVGQVGGTKSKVFFGVDCSKEANAEIFGYFLLGLLWCVLHPVFLTFAALVAVLSLFGVPA